MLFMDNYMLAYYIKKSCLHNTKQTTNIFHFCFLKSLQGLLEHDLRN